MNNYSYKWNSVEVKLLRTILFSFAIGVVIAGTVITIVIENIYHANMIKNLDFAGAVVTDKLSDPLVFSDIKVVQESFEFIANNQNIDLMCLYSVKGALLFNYEKNSTQCESVTAPITNILSVENNNFSRSIPIFESYSDAHGLRHLSDRLPLGYVYFQANNTALVSEAQRIFILLLFLSLFASALVKFLTRRSFTPLDKLYKLSTIITENPFSKERIEKKEDDEVGEVIEVFNNMLDNLAKEHRELNLSENRFRKLAENAPIGIFLKTEFDEYQYILPRHLE